MSKVDLHIHTTASDGKFTPAEIVRKAATLGLQFIAITDHDTVDGILPALEAGRVYPSLRVIPAVELSTDVPDGEVHVLGYFIDYNQHGFKVNLKKLRDSRTEHARKMVEKLNGLGINIDWQRVQEIAGNGALGRPHIARAMLEKGYIESFKDAFNRYIGHNGPAYVEREKLTPVEAAQLVIKANGLPVLAHPLTAANTEATIIELKAAGLVGVEVYYAGYTIENMNPLLALANQYSLIPTGGTDYHGNDNTNEAMIGDVNVPMTSVQRLITLAKERGLKTDSLVGKESL